jgi:hypothetical protein
VIPLKKKLEEDIRIALPALVKRFQGGDSSAKEDIAILLLPYVEFIVNKYKDSIKDHPKSMAGWITTRIINRLDKIDMQKSFVGFICRSTINYCIDRYRTVRRKKYKTVEYLPNKNYDLSFNSVNDEESIRFYLEGVFTKNDAEVLDLYYLQNKTFHEISCITGYPELEIKETIELVKTIPL